MYSSLTRAGKDTVVVFFVGFYCWLLPTAITLKRPLVSAISHPPSIETMSRHPEVLWAQRSDKVYLTIALPDAKDVSVKCEGEGLFSFSAVGGSKTKVGLRNIICSIQKEEKVWWKRLLKSEGKPAPYIKVDWNKWCDEDDEKSASDASDDNNAGDEKDDGSSDDEGMLYLPDLEKARGN
ncbi:hypothetical protein POTOM_058097 [Populus tomentosa]|uniref:Co-chaperone protein p23 n=1 Tax=Populus tomentosa TaxID=118781 RepID=A0A8X7XWD9_POPTO|nr:hypothetical protein POTOM_058097 [Populus tomentosa]